MSDQEKRILRTVTLYMVVFFAAAAALLALAPEMDVYVMFPVAGGAVVAVAMVLAFREHRRIAPDEGEGSTRRLRVRDGWWTWWWGD